MTLKEFRDILTVKSNEIDNLMRRHMPVIAGQIAKSHFQDNFHKSGFVNGGLKMWKPAKRQSNPGKKAAGNYGTLLSGRSHLFKSINYFPGDGQVTIQNNVEYASIHNEGGTIQSHPTVTPKMKKFAWAKYYESLNVAKGAKVSKNTTIPEDAQRWRALALTKKNKLNITTVMPRRQFIGESKELDEKLTNKLEEELIKIFNL